MENPSFIVEGVDLEDGARVCLYESDNSAACRDWLSRYTRRLEDDGRAGGWALIEIYDVRWEDAERIACWESKENDK